MGQTRLNHQLSESADAVNLLLDSLLVETNGPENRVVKAMRYACLGEGKRIRPFLLLASAKLFEADKSQMLRAAAAVEMVHCYSLVHDDLPAMDNDELRRGKPTLHVKFDEATAILAGDALLTQAFEVLADKETHADPSVRASLISVLAKAAGSAGMVGGQMADLYAENNDLSLDDITKLQRMKTGALIVAACEMGAIIGGASDQAHQSICKFALDIGLAFQIADDLLDVTGIEAEVGKKIQKDTDAGKATFVSLIGVNGAREKAQSLSSQAQDHLKSFGEKAEPLRSLANFIVNRRS